MGAPVRKPAKATPVPPHEERRRDGGRVTRRERATAEKILEALEVGDTFEAVELVVVLLDEAEEAACGACGRAPAQMWSCPTVRECARLAEAA